ncbi:MAG: anhydro-N-acetylmuramic acid kinase [Alphaproteobacteria bacterium]
MNAQWVVGMMSGTSLDGIDVAAIKTDGLSVFEIGPAKLYPYDIEFVEEIRRILGSHEETPYIKELEKKLTVLHAEAYENFLKTFNIPRAEIKLIGFHGHTILHESPKKFPKGRTWQLGDGALLSEMTKTPVVWDMRQNDVQHGGEGAPLVPVYHQALLRNFQKPVAVLNVGGVANITWISDDDLVAFDTGPGNALINDWVWKKLQIPYDVGGAIAAKGKCDQKVLEHFGRNPYFAIKPPKSLDRNEFSLEVVEHLSVEDGAATLTEMTVLGVFKALQFLPETPKVWYISGGGRHNKTLCQRLEHYLKPACVDSIDILNTDGDFVEAQAFAFLAMRSVKGLPLSFPHTTGVAVPLAGGMYKFK